MTNLTTCKRNDMRERAATATWSPMTAYYVATMLTIGLTGVIS